MNENAQTYNSTGSFMRYEDTAEGQYQSLVVRPEIEKELDLEREKYETNAD